MNTKLMIIMAVALAGCATTPVPADKLSRSSAAIKSAEEMNAVADPQAALHLKLAKEQLHSAKALMKDGDNKKAILVLLRAEADGEAALNLARARIARIEAEQTIEMVRQAMAQMQEGRGS